MGNVGCQTTQSDSPKSTGTDSSYSRNPIEWFGSHDFEASKFKSILTLCFLERNRTDFVYTTCFCTFTNL